MPVEVILETRFDFVNHCRSSSLSALQETSTKPRFASPPDSGVSDIRLPQYSKLLQLDDCKLAVQRAWKLHIADITDLQRKYQNAKSAGAKSKH
ncbi:hypothetical protein CDL15_Pgr011823 [Punica granatum]|uniref:Uncharacterized protein n=1 Tax=Punica granatum TaxID=22663 RepID=A0A218XF80_PUNGR|nr:hypothetical protein CDL15_Pgr011823 [Punica granatum]